MTLTNIAKNSGVKEFDIDSVIHLGSKVRHQVKLVTSNQENLKIEILISLFQMFINYTRPICSSKDRMQSVKRRKENRIERIYGGIEQLWL